MKENLPINPPTDTWLDEENNVIVRLGPEGNEHYKVALPIKVIKATVRDEKLFVQATESRWIPVDLGYPNVLIHLN